MFVQSWGHFAFSNPFLDRFHLNKDVHTHLKCNLVNFEIPKSFPYVVQKSIWDLKIDKITFQMGVYILYSSEIYAATGEKMGNKYQSIDENL